jgi:hypothetical protein
MVDCPCAMKIIYTEAVVSFVIDPLCPSHIHTPAFIDVAIEINLSFTV